MPPRNTSMPPQPAFTFGKVRDMEIVIVNVDPAQHATRRHIAPGLAFETAGTCIGHIVEPAFRPALSRCACRYCHGQHDRDAEGETRRSDFG